MIKTIAKLILISGVFLFTGCDKDFEKINTNPYAITSIDPALLFAGAQRHHLGNWAGENLIVQHFAVPYNTGANLGFNFNEDIDDYSNPKWGVYNGSLKNIIHAMDLLGPTTARVNLMNMLRIWKAEIFMELVDTYGDVPYSEAGKAVSEAIFFPKYDNDEAIYDDIYKEFKAGIAALNPSGDFVSADLFYGANAQPSVKTGNANDQVAKWKKLGNSLLLRLGMRYSKINPTKAQSIVAEAFAGGVMTSNADNAYVKPDGTIYTQADNAALQNFSQFNYAAEAFVNQLKSTNDPRGKFMIAQFADPGKVSNDANPDTVLANQYGVPLGKTDAQLSVAPYRGTRGGGLNYSQFNIWTIAAPGAPEFYVTYAQTALLLAEAAKRGWIPGGDATAQTYYESAIRADMAVYSLYSKTVPITTAEVNAYLARPEIAYDPANALKLINTQYWIVNVRNGTEAWANFRRSGFPVLSPNLFNNNLNGGFVRRMSYPNVEASSNTANYQAAATAIGGDKLTSKVFWDNP
jgi:hypothetical protein